MSYYKYKERVREDLKPVDYGAIQTGLNKGFEDIQTEQADKREKRETDIAELRTDVTKELEQAREAARTNKGDDTFNAQVLSMANQSAQHMRALENLLRAGKINPSDYAIQRQNLIDSVTQLRVVTAAYKDSINQAVTRQEDDLAGVIEANEMNNVQGVLDLQNHQLMIDPSTGMVRMHDINNGTTEGIGEVQVRMMNKYDKYDFTGKVGEYAKLLDTVIEDNGYVRTENPFSLAGGRDLEASIRENFVNGISENDKASILLDSSTGYSIIQGVRSEADYEKWKETATADEIAKGIWLKPDSKLGGRVNAVLQDEQKEAVVEKAIAEVKVQTKYSKTITPRERRQTDVERKAQEETDKMISYGDALYRVFNDADKTGASAAIASIIGNDFVELSFSDGGKKGTLTMMEGSGKNRREVTKTIDFSGNYSDFVKNYGGALLNIKDVARYEDELIGGRGDEVFDEEAEIKGGYKVGRGKKLETDVTIEDAIEVVDKKLDTTRYLGGTSGAISDMTERAKEMFDKLDVSGDMYTISTDGDIITIQVGELPPHDFNAEVGGHDSTHGQRRRSFINLMKKIYVELTTGKAQPQTAKEAGLEGLRRKQEADTPPEEEKTNTANKTSLNATVRKTE
jgi:hypothetical protein|tara:strand:+ start:264 stop:2147 length:1884 start_codon:yes stop_codon:yes gene_type:complete